MAQEDITFEKFLGLERLLAGKPFDENMWQAYIKLSSYVLNHEQVNMMHIDNIDALEKLAAKLSGDGQFFADDSALRECALMMMRRFIDYKIYVNRHEIVREK